MITTRNEMLRNEFVQALVNFPENKLTEKEANLIADK